MRVRRGKDWKWGAQDHVNGEESTGTITVCQKDNWAKVQWDGGIASYYRVGTNGSFDLSIVGKYRELSVTSKYKLIIS